MLCFDISENPYKNFIEDARVMELHSEFSGKWDKNAMECGFPDKFVDEAVQDYLWYYHYILAPVSRIVLKTADNRQKIGKERGNIIG